jgi:hypothetical protein
MKRKDDYIPYHFITPAYLVDKDGDFIPKPFTKNVEGAVGDFKGLLLGVIWNCQDHKISLSGKQPEMYSCKVLFKEGMTQSEFDVISKALRFSMYSRLFGNSYNALQKDNETKFFRKRA